MGKWDKVFEVAIALVTLIVLAMSVIYVMSAVILYPILLVDVTGDKWHIFGYGWYFVVAWLMWHLCKTK